MQRQTGHQNEILAHCDCLLIFVLEILLLHSNINCARLCEYWSDVCYLCNTYYLSC